MMNENAVRTIENDRFVTAFYHGVKLLSVAISPAVHLSQQCVDFRVGGQQISFKSYVQSDFARISHEKSPWHQSLMDEGLLYSRGQLANSGSLFYLTPCSRFVIKTISHREHRFLLRKISEYCKYLLQEPESFLVMFRALLRIKVEGMVDRCIVVMDNVVSTGEDKELTGHLEVYDLKAHGLCHFRDTRDLKKLMQQYQFAAVSSRHRMPESEQIRVRLQLERDVSFLSRINANDYIILLSIFTSPELTELDVVLIDILSPWDWKRKFGWLLLPGAFFYYPRFMRPKVYARRVRATLDLVLLQQSTQ